MRKTLTLLAVLALIGGGVALAASGTADDVLNGPARADCPGRIECPLTGEMICADECPLNNAEKADVDVSPCCKSEGANCPGKIECPLTGEMICADDCPLNDGQEADGDVPPCCKGK